MVKLDNIRIIRETFSEKEANNLLDDGFKILKIFSAKTSNSNYEVCQPVFVLGSTRKKKR